jgi:hypothetical protein
MNGLNFIVETKVAPAGVIANLYVQGLTEDVWKTYISAIPMGHYVVTGDWGTSEDDAVILLKRVIEKEVKKLSNHRDPRPSQVRRVELLKMGLASI